MTANLAAALTKIAATGDAPMIAAAVQAHGVGGEVIAALLIGSMHIADDTLRAHVVEAMATAVFAHPDAGNIAPWLPAHTLLLNQLPAATTNNNLIDTCLTVLGTSEQVLAALWQGVHNVPQKLRLARIILNKDQNAFDFDTSPTRELMLRVLGADGTDMDIANAVYLYGGSNKAVATLWRGADMATAGTILKSARQKDAVIAGVLTPRPGNPVPFISEETFLKMLRFIGHLGTEDTIALASRRVQDRELYLKTLCAGTEIRVSETVAGGMRQKDAVCRAVAANLPYKCDVTPPLEEMLTRLGEIGTYEELVQVIARCRHDARARSALEAGAAITAKANKDEATRVTWIAALFAAGDAAAPGPVKGPRLSDKLGQHPARQKALKLKF